MRTQSKRFIVEVKRGTSRSAFVSLDAAADKFSSAELALFGAPPQRSAAPEGVEAPQPQGRILRSLIEPPAPAVEIPEPPRRGRKPGSKNKPKLAPATSAEGASVPAVTSPSAEARAFAAPPSIHPSAPPEASSMEPSVPQVSGEAATVATPAARERARLRVRSSILRRYVLGIEPRPGDPGYRRAKRAAKALR